MNRNLYTWLRRATVATALLFFVANSGAAEGPVLPPLTTVSGSPRLPGKFVWADLVTDDVPAARNFYSQLFGWTMHNVGNYTIAANDGRPLCGMFQKPRPTDPNAKPRWFGYMSVGNVDRTQKAVIKAGGKVLAAPQKMPKRGEQAVFADAEGAIFGVVKSADGDPQDFLPDPGDWIWIQLFSRDAKKASEFYKSLAGYEVIENNSTNRMSDFILSSEGYARATVRGIPAKEERIRPNWLPFVRVKDIGEALIRAKLLGGKVLIEPKPEVFDGKVAVVADPTGGAIGLMEWSVELAKGAK